MPFADVGDVSLYYEFTGPEDKPLILQFGGSLFGRANFDSVNDGFRENFRLLSYDASGYGRSTQPLTSYSVEGWADEAAGLLDALGIDRVLTHGTSMGGMVGIAFTAKYPDHVIASCADCGMVRCDTYRRLLFRNWRQQCEALPMDDFCDLLTIQAVGADFVEAHPEVFDAVKRIVNANSPYTVRQACLAMETMDLEPLIDGIRRPAAADERQHGHHDPVAARAVRLQRRARSPSGCRTGRACTSSPTSATPTSSRSPTRPCASSRPSSRRSSPARRAAPASTPRWRRSAGDGTRVPPRPRPRACGRTPTRPARGRRSSRRSWSGCRP